MPSNCTSGDIRLSGKQTPESGRLEVCINQAWGSLCNYYWEYRDAQVVCRELGFQQFYGEFIIMINNYDKFVVGCMLLFRFDCQCVIC